MKRTFFSMVLPLIAAGALIAGCGSNSSSSGSGASAARTATGDATAPGNPYSTGGGGSSAASTSGASSASRSGATTVTTKASKFGTILAAGSKQLTVYLFDGDHGSGSNCSGGCATAWPPVTTTAAPIAGGGALSADLATITRSDGTKQVTYNGHPLYFFIRDKDSGDAYGEGVTAFGASWYVLAPNGGKVDNS